MSRLMHGLCAAILAVVMAPSLAQTCRFEQRPTDPEAGERLLASLAREGCLGSVDDPEPRTGEFHATIGTRDQPGGPLALQDALEQLHRHARTRSREPVLMSVWSGLAREIERIIERLPDPAAMPPAGYQSAVVDIVSPRWKAASGQGTGEPIDLDGVRFKAIRPLACRTDGDCSEWLTHVDVVRSINLLVQVQTHVQSPVLQAQLRDSQTELARWQAYRRDSRHQYIWELWANSQLMARDSSICARDGSNGLVGFCQVPTSQLVLLHPDAGLIATRPSGQPTQLQPALIVDVIGRHTLSWEDERSARIARQWGYALSAVYAQVDGRPQWSYGPRLHRDGYNLALTRSEGGGWNLVVSLNLAERYMERKESYTRDLMRVKDSGLFRALDR